MAVTLKERAAIAKAIKTDPEGWTILSLTVQTGLTGEVVREALTTSATRKPRLKPTAKVRKPRRKK